MAILILRLRRRSNSSRPLLFKRSEFLVFPVEAAAVSGCSAAFLFLRTTVRCPFMTSWEQAFSFKRAYLSFVESSSPSISIWLMICLICGSVFSFRLPKEGNLDTPYSLSLARSLAAKVPAMTFTPYLCPVS